MGPWMADPASLSEAIRGFQPGFYTRRQSHWVLISMLQSSIEAVLLPLQAFPFPLCWLLTIQSFLGAEW